MMTLESFFSGKDAPDFLQILASCMNSVGTEEFNGHFLKMIERVIKADQCTIFSYNQDRPQCYLSFNEQHRQAGQNHAQKYLRNGYLQDPLLPAIEDVKIDGKMRLFTLRELQVLAPKDYFYQFFKFTGIIDRISILAGSDSEVIGINFYRNEKNGQFIISDDSLRYPFWQVVSKIVLMHYCDSRSPRIKSPLNSLSGREKEVCQAIHRGLTTEAIAWELGVAPSSINTYRKRAYEKLGINSKSALFSICNVNK